MAKKIIGYGSFFCWNCGQRIENKKKNCHYCGSKYSKEDKYGNVSALDAGGVGWSNKTNHPCFKEYSKNNRKYVLIWLTGISIIVPAALIFTGEIKIDTEGIMVIGGVIAVFWIIGLIFLFKNHKNMPAWDGIVEDKKTLQKIRRRKDHEGKKYEESYTEYIVYIRRENNDIFELKKEDSDQFDYFRKGDYVHYHGDKSLNYIEKYDKSFDTTVFCACCGDINDIRNNYCERCGCILLKAD